MARFDVCDVVGFLNLVPKRGTDWRFKTELLPIPPPLCAGAKKFRGQ